MNPVERVIRRVDAAQQRHTPSAFVFGLIKKYGDDNAGILAASLAHSCFVALFPLLLILVTVLGLIAAGNPALRAHILEAATKQFPLVGNELRANVQELHRSSLAGLIFGLILLIWGAGGLAQSGLFTMAQVWNLPGPDRPGYVPRLGRAMLFICVLGLGVSVTAGLSFLGSLGRTSGPVTALLELGAVAANIGMFLIGFRVLTPKAVPFRRLIPGCVVAGIIWTLMLAIGTRLVEHYVRVDSVYGVFASVLGLIAWIYLGVQVVVYSAELNVVIARRLWPRSIVQPPLTAADRRVLADQALQNQRRDDQRVDVTFDQVTPEAVGSPETAGRPETAGSPEASRGSDS
jgi:YihY family inner membrane protein